MRRKLPELTFDRHALTPFLGSDTLEAHHGSHHAGYVETLNRLQEGTPFAELSLTELVRAANGALFDNAAQHYNHSFYWCCLRAGAPERPSGALLEAVERGFGSLDALRERFQEAALSLFGSGWVWLARTEAGDLHVRALANADCPLVHGETPVLVCDVWEHAYYLDYKSDRAGYVESFLAHVDWTFAGRCYDAPEEIEAEISGV